MIHHQTYTESYVATLYERINIQTPLQLDFQLIAHRLGIKVFYWPEQSQALFFKDTGYIMLNNTLSPQQQWQDFTHELGHVLLHTGSQTRLPKSFVEYQEFKAKQFMLHASVPTFMLENLALSDATQPNILLVQQLFNVEEEIATKRLNSYLERKWDILNRNI
ncbi:ImmA/IrrE family metallo-endopeptidase [Lysinibacillus sp. 3P01SB]|uniref:ImmA/IrrE family metallo-endopeptidase n=1 Tax=Lysinibacillus sp. 3P01SB TaxID=3132284 RepID=UPI0039A766C6